MLRMPALETARLTIRPFFMDDLQSIHRILDVELKQAELGTEGALSVAEREEWMRWTVLNYEQLANLNQPPYGDRAVTLQPGGQLIGACGFVPCMNPFGQLPGFLAQGPSASERLTSTEFGLFYAIAPDFQGQGYATEAARAMVEYAFAQLRLRRVVATTTYDNLASIGVMHKLGMRIERNPYPEPPWLQVVGLLENMV